MELMWSGFLPATCRVNSTRVDVRVCSCKNPYVGVATFVVQNTSHVFSLDMSCEPTYAGALAAVNAAYATGTTQKCLYNGNSVMWEHYQSTVLWTWLWCTIGFTSVYLVFALAALLSRRGK